MIKQYLKKIFKKISYGFFIKIYGLIENSIQSSNEKRIKVSLVKIKKGPTYKFYRIFNGRLYTDRIQDTAAILDNKIIEGPSFQLRKRKDTSIFNSNIRDNIVFTKGTPRRLRKIKGSVFSLLTGGAGNNNYWHWIFDVLPRFEICRKIIDLNNIDYFLLPSILKKFQIETLDCLNIPSKKRISSEKFRHIQSDELIITDHPVMITGNATEDILNIPPWISEWLKITFLKEKIDESKKDIKNIYIDRSEEKTAYLPQRQISNESEVKEYLLKKNFTVVRLHETNFIDQVSMFQNARCVVGLHGGGFANIVFCRPKTKIIELKSLTAGDAIKNLAIKNDLDYTSVATEAKQIYKFTKPNQQGSIEVPIEDLNKFLMN